MGKLRKGDAAPEFSAGSVNMGEVTLGSYRGKEVNIVFSRYFGCPVCQYEFDELLEHRKKHPQINIVYINQSLAATAKAYIEGKGVDFPVIAAEKTSEGYPLYGLYGVGSFGPVAAAEILLKARRAKAAGKVHGPYEGNEMQSPAQFHIDADGKIASAHYGLLDTGKLA